MKNFYSVIYLMLLKFIMCHNYLSYTGPCRRSDPKLENCLIRAFENSRIEFANGNWTNEIQIRPLDPFNLQNHIFGNGRIFELITNNMTVVGLSNYKVERYSVNLNSLTVDITMFFPKISDTGVYSGTINLLGTNFIGSFKSRYRNTRAFLHFEMQRYWRDGREFVEILDMKLSSDKKFIALESSHSVHDKVIPIIYPFLERSYGLIIKDELNGLLERVPLQQLLPE